MTQALQVHWCVQAVFYLFAVNYSFLISHRSPVLVPLGQNLFKHHPERFIVLSVVIQCVTFDPSFRGQQVPIRFQSCQFFPVPTSPSSSSPFRKRYLGFEQQFHIHEEKDAVHALPLLIVSVRCTFYQTLSASHCQDSLHNLF